MIFTIPDNCHEVKGIAQNQSNFTCKPVEKIRLVDRNSSDKKKFDMKEDCQNSKWISKVI